jgi:hypothetical protein
VEPELVECPVEWVECPEVSLVACPEVSLAVCPVVSQVLVLEEVDLKSTKSINRKEIGLLKSPFFSLFCNVLFFFPFLKFG